MSWLSEADKSVKAVFLLTSKLVSWLSLAYNSIKVVKPSIPVKSEIWESFIYNSVIEAILEVSIWLVNAKSSALIPFVIIKACLKFASSIIV